MKNLSRKYFILVLLAVFVLFLSCKNESGNTGNDPLVIWETDSFTVEVENSIFMERMKYHKKGWGDMAIDFEKKIKPNTRNLFSIANRSEKDMLEDWTGNAYRRKDILIMNKISSVIETDIEERDYSDLGSSGTDILIRDNKLFRIIEIVN